MILGIQYRDLETGIQYSSLDTETGIYFLFHIFDVRLADVLIIRVADQRLFEMKNFRPNYQVISSFPLARGSGLTSHMKIELSLDFVVKHLYLFDISVWNQ